MSTKHRINWSVIDKMLEETESTPQDLLDWLEWGFENLAGDAFICSVRPYLGRFYFDLANTSGIHQGNETITDIFCKHIITGMHKSRERFTPAATWSALHTDLDFRAEMISRFKKQYELK